MDLVASRTDAEAVAIQTFLARSGIVNPMTGQPYSIAIVLGLGGRIGMMLFVFTYHQLEPTVGMITWYHTKAPGTPALPKARFTVPAVG